ncbi:hypothetical protein A3H66_01895 [Candidatus Falkowbacteria bacterium RIFCSPLOWO2_02_FULL_45_21]|uniref:Uncharacterized protein n=1 Tax=Candidatus Falkowbacteria bacterium RIFCSPLOWO2_02_FULL_45_21 TaxID=1797989 RepID=A0A1F5SCX9_9BACT|nr:MAG: hypothetical protein A3H66_01895 [Candidatus Falkowbacteria bacterium RIFCSPLOWO2_02_FULL_45_21]
MIEAKKLVSGLVPNSGPRRPADYVRNLRLIVPRAAADALTVSNFPDSAFDGLAEYTGAEAVKTMLSQIDTAIQELGSLKSKIEAAQKRWFKQAA